VEDEAAPITPNTSGSLARTRNTHAAAKHSLFIGNQIKRPHKPGGHAIVECRSMTSLYFENIEKRNCLQKTNHPCMPICTSPLHTSQRRLPPSATGSCQGNASAG
jgi:hypothetical protein